MNETGTNVSEEKSTADIPCNVCEALFSTEREGGIVGCFGILPVAFCPTCLACMIDMVYQLDEMTADGEEN